LFRLDPASLLVFFDFFLVAGFGYLSFPPLSPFLYFVFRFSILLIFILFISF